MLLLGVNWQGKEGKPKSRETELLLSASDAGLRTRWVDAIRKVVSDLDAVVSAKEAAEQRDKVNNLRAVVGCTRDACLAALAQSSGDFHSALDLLLAQTDGGGGGASAGAAASGSSAAANRASSSAVETKDDEMCVGAAYRYLSGCVYLDRVGSCCRP